MKTTKGQRAELRRLAAGLDGSPTAVVWVAPHELTALLDDLDALEGDNASLEVHLAESRKARAFVEGDAKGTTRLTAEQLQAIGKGWDADVRRARLGSPRYNPSLEDFRRLDADIDLAAEGKAILAARLKEAKG